MSYTVQLKIENYVLWSTLCRLSSLSGATISEILSQWVDDKLLVEHAKKIVSGLILENHELADLPEFKAIMSAETDEEGS